MHTSLPWHVGASGVTIWGDDGRVKIADHIEPEHAELIVRSVNAHERLLSVVKELSDSAAYWSEYDVPLGIVDRLRAAIANAEVVTHVS